MSTKFQRKLKCKETILDIITDWFSEKFHDFIIVPYKTIKRFCYWGWKFRYNYDWDCTYLTYYMLYLKLKGLIDYSRKYAHLCWNSKEDGKEFRKLKIACELAKRLYEYDYKTHMNAHDEKWGRLEMHFIESNCDPYIKHGKLLLERPNANTAILKEKELKEWQIAEKLDREQKDHERKYLYKILEKYLDYWWD